MTKKVTVVLEEDLTGGPAGQTIRFAFDGAGYEIDLNAENAATFGRQLAPYLEHARRAGRAQPRRPGRTAAGRQRPGDIRAWAKEHALGRASAGASRPAWWNGTTRPAGASTNHQPACCHNRRAPRSEHRGRSPDGTAQLSAVEYEPATPSGPSPCTKRTCSGYKHRPLRGRSGRCHGRAGWISMQAERAWPGLLPWPTPCGKRTCRHLGGPITVRLPAYGRVRLLGTDGEI